MNKHNDIIIPGELAELSGIQPGDSIAVHTAANTLLVTPEHMSAMEAVNTLALLMDVAADLVHIFKDACGACRDQLDEDGCPFGELDASGDCPLEDVRGPQVELSDAARRDLGISLDAKLALFADEGEGLVCAADYDYDIADVPDSVRTLLDRSGVCPGRLNDLLMSGEEIWHA